MVNPDGVILGNSRTSFSGYDLNRQYNDSDEVLFPEVAFIQNLMQSCYKEQKIFAFLDFHGHSSKKNAFLYGPEYSIWEA